MRGYTWIEEHDGSTRCVGRGSWEWAHWNALHLDESVTAPAKCVFVTLTEDASATRYRPIPESEFETTSLLDAEMGSA